VHFYELGAGGNAVLMRSKALYTELILTTFWKMLPNVLKLFGNGIYLRSVDFYDLFKNFMVGLSRDQTGRVFQNVNPAQKFLATTPSCS